MGKRKSSAPSKEQGSGPDLDVSDSKKRIRDYEDVADSDDEFHLQRDRVLLGEEPEAKRRRKWQEQEDFLEPSDEEVLAHSDDDDIEEDDEDGIADTALRQTHDGGSSGDSDNAREEDDEDELGWGTSKADLYGADAIETEEQALEEEAEALRLQKKHVQSMSAADYGFDESEWQDAGKEIQDELQGETVVEKLPQLQVTDEMSAAERLKLLKTRYPEFELLSKELLQMNDVHAELVEIVKTTPSNPNVIIKLRAASAYVGVLTMYFALLTSTASQGQVGVTTMSAVRLRDHPVMDSLVQCRELWQRVRDLPIGNSGADDDKEDDSNFEEMSMDDLEVVKEAIVPSKKSRAQKHADAAQAAADKRRAERLAKTEAGLADLDALVAPLAPRKKTKRGANGGDSDIGEEAVLTGRQAADKAKRKKSLRFYTSQIAQKANKRGESGRNAGGDEDVPHRERLRDRQARLNAEAEKRGKKRADAGADLGGESDEDDDRQARQIRAEADEGDYYDLVAARTAKKKSSKAALAEAQKQAALQGGRVIEEATVGADGKRKISYAIEKNKGLTPRRKKDVRNPRVKKRKKYDEKKKKLASMKPTYKGGEGRGGYGGELTGIKKGLVKSTKL